jgi:hypothetical protein
MKEIKSFDELDAFVKGFMTARVVLSAVYLDIFAKIGDGAKTAKDLAAFNNWDERGTVILCDALCAMGLIKKEGLSYKNTKFSDKYLRRDRPSFKGWGILHRNTMWIGWSNLTEIIMKKPHSKPSNLRNREFNEYFINAMHQFHCDEAKEIADLIGIEKVEKMIDLGGGPGS